MKLPNALSAETKTSALWLALASGIISEREKLAPTNNKTNTVKMLRDLFFKFMKRPPVKILIKV